MNQVQVFSSNQFGEIRTLDENGKVLFCGSDVAWALGYNEPHKAISRHCRCGMKRPVPHPQSETKQIEMLFIPEGDVYRLITHSKLPEAQKFESWVFDEVLPSVRRNGGYIAGQETMSDDDLLSRALMVAQRKIEEKTAQLAAANAQIEADRPKVVFADAVSTSETAILVRELAKLLTQNGYKTGERRLYDKLRTDGYLIKSGSDYNLPTQRAMDMGLFVIKETVIHDSMGNAKISRTPKVTGRGQQYFINKYLKEVPNERETGNT